MPTSIIKAIPTNQPWAGDTPNKIVYNEQDLSQGIKFKSNIVSNQLNTALNDLSENMRFMQCSGGVYIQNMRYYRGHIVALHVITNDRYGIGVRFFQCINDNNGVGIVNEFPYLNVTNTTDGNGLKIYSANGINTTYWRECDAVGRELQDKVQNALSDKWKHLGAVRGNFDMNFGGNNNNFNNFTIDLTGSTQFNNILAVNSAKERSGLLVIKRGGANLKKFFNAGVAYFTFDIPFAIIPQGSNNGSMMIFPYKLIPQLNKVIFTRC